MACARSGSIFCWPRAVVFFLPLLLAVVYLDLLLRAAAAVPDFACVPVEGRDAVWPLAEEDELDRVPFAAAVVCFLAFAVLELAVLELAVLELAVLELAVLEPGVFDLAAALAVAGFAVVGFALLGLVLLCVFESEADVCPSAGEAQKHVNAKAQTAPSHLRILAQCFPFGSKGDPQVLSDKNPSCLTLPASLATDHCSLTTFFCPKQNPTEAGIVIILHQRRQCQFPLG
jgi:hypothetical protein